MEKNLKLSIIKFGSDLEELSKSLKKTDYPDEDTRLKMINNLKEKLNSDLNEIIKNLEYSFKKSPLFKDSKGREQFSQRFNEFHKEAVASLENSLKKILDEITILPKN